MLNFDELANRMQIDPNLLANIGLSTRTDVNKMLCIVGASMTAEPIKMEDLESIDIPLERKQKMIDAFNQIVKCYQELFAEERKAMKQAEVEDGEIKKVPVERAEKPHKDLFSLT